MIDVGLLMSLAVMVLAMSLFVRPFPSEAVEAGVVDTALGAAMIGLVVGRVSAMVVDEPNSLLSVPDLLVIRSGVEFWPGLAVGLGWISYRARSEGVSAWLRLAALAPSGLIAWAAYEATCLARDGCPGPASAIGLRPRGLTTTVFPIGLAIAVAATGVAVGLSAAHRRGRDPREIVLAGVAGIALIRSVASIWLPRVGDGLTRQHRTSLLIAAFTFIGWSVVHRRACQASQNQAVV